MLSWEQLQLLLACPMCRSALEREGDSALRCTGCQRGYPVEHGLPVLLPTELGSLAHEEAEAHAELAPGYEQQHQLESLRNLEAHARLLAPLIALGPGRRVLELACGTGNDARRLLAAGQQVLGVDVTLEMLRVAQAQTPEPAHLGLAVADAQRLPVAERGFDAALIVAALHHLDDPPAALAEIRRALRPGGLLVVGMEPNTWMYSSLIPVWRRLRRFVARARDAVHSPADEHTHGFDARQLRELLAQAGFELLELQRVWYLAGFLQAVLETLSRLRGSGRHYHAPRWLERPVLALDGIWERLPLLRRLNWNWTAVARVAQHP